MKILIIHCAYQYKGGEDTVVEEEMNLLKQSGLEVELLLFTNEGNPILKILQFPFNFSSYRKTRKKIELFRPDIVHIHNLHFAASPSVIYAVKQSKVPLVCTLHNYRLLCPSAILFYQGHVFLDSLQRAFPWKAVKKGVYKNSRLLTFWMAFAMQVHHWLGTWHLPNRFVVLSKHAKELFMQSRIKFREGQLIIKPNFCSLPPLKAVNRTGEFVFIGRLSEEKGVPLLLKAFSSSTHKITIVGDGPLREEVRTYSQKYPNISYAGYLQKTEVVNLLSHSSALVFPSIWYEAMPLTIIEALACGTPVIATELGAMEYMVTPNQDGILFEAGNEIKLQQALNIWADLSTSEKEMYSKNARATYEQFYTPEKNAEQLLAIYHSVQKVPEPASLSFAG